MWQGGPVAIEEVPVIQPQELKAGEALVRVKCEYCRARRDSPSEPDLQFRASTDSGVCHTDLHAMLGDWPVDNKLPLIGGHEGAG